METYYLNCDRSRDDKSYKWNKSGDIQTIFDSCPKKETNEIFVTYMEAMAGTFLFWWSDKIQTIHNRNDYKNGTVFSKTIDDKIYIYAEIDGTILETPRVDFVKK